MSEEKLVLKPFLSRKTGATEVYLIRHADALPGEERVIPGGGYDAQPLSALGQRQAQALGEWLAPVQFEAIYSSPLRRTQETALPLAERQGLNIQSVPNLREVRLGLDVGGPAVGENAGTTAASLRKRLAEVVRRVGETGKWSSIPGSEASEPFRARVVETIQELANRHAGQRVAVFSHGGVINAYIAVLLGLERDFFYPIYNTSYCVVRCQGRQSSLVSLNETAHLRALAVDLEE